MAEQHQPIEVPGAGAVSAIRVDPDRLSDTLLIYAPGAGSNLHDPFGAYLSRELLTSGVRSEERRVGKECRL